MYGVCLQYACILLYKQQIPLAHAHASRLQQTAGLTGKSNPVILGSDTSHARGLIYSMQVTVLTRSTSYLPAAQGTW